MKSVVGGLTLSSLGAGLYLIPKRVPGPTAGAIPYEVRPKLYTGGIENHPNKHVVTREPKRVAVIGAGIAGCSMLKELTV
jgi:hypothetical protein